MDTTTLVRIVFDMESHDAPMPIGVFLYQTEDTITYLRPDSEAHHVPEDHVCVVWVHVPGSID